MPEDTQTAATRGECDGMFVALESVFRRARPWPESTHNQLMNIIWTYIDLRGCAYCAAVVG